MNSYRIRDIAATTRDPGVDTAQFPESRILRVSLVPPSIIRYVYYAFIFSLPIESADLDIAGIPLAKMFGFILVTVTVAAVLVQKPHFCLKPPPKAFWCFAGYLVVYAALGSNEIMTVGAGAELTESIIQGVKTLGQLLIFLWISFSLLQYERITKGAFVSLVVSCIVVAIFQSFGMTGSITNQDRTAAFDSNENAIAVILSTGLLLAIGLGYGRAKTDLKIRWLCWICSAGLAVMIVVTGSRGAMIALFLALLVFFLHGRSLKVKLKVGVVVVLALAFLGWLSYEVEPVRERWERTYYEGDTAGRDVIFAAAWEMFLEKPLTGWGPVNNISELGSRLGLRDPRDTHNTYLWLLTESGLIGSTLFFVGLGLCWNSAWLARRSIQGALPMALLVFVLADGMKGTIHADKLFWIILSYALASGSNAIGLHQLRERF